MLDDMGKALCDLLGDIMGMVTGLIEDLAKAMLSPFK